MITRRHFLAAGTACAAAAALPLQAQTQALRIIVGFAPGGSADTLGRHLGSNLKVPGMTAAIVENRAGAGGRIAVEAVRTAAADGRTLLLTPGSIMSIYPFVYDNLTYDPVKDFAPVTPLATVPYSISVGPMVPDSVTTLKEFAAWCKANPGQASYGSPGAGTTPHFLGVMFGQSTGIAYQHVPYRGGALALQEVMAGQIASSVNVVSEAVQLARGGKVRVLAVSSAERLPQLPDVPTMAEAGFADLQSEEWFGLFLPAGTPADTVAAMNAAAIAAFQTESVRKAMNDMAFTAAGSTPAEFGKRLQADLDRWGPVVKSTGYKAEA